MHNTNILPICPGRVVPVTLTHQISHGEESSESKQLYELYEQCKSLTSSEFRINQKDKPRETPPSNTTSNCMFHLHQGIKFKKPHYLIFSFPALSFVLF